MKRFARTSARKKPSSSRKKGGRRWRWLVAIFLVIIPALVVAAVLATYAIWAQTFDLKRLGTMPERNTVFDVDAQVTSQPGRVSQEHIHRLRNLTQQLESELADLERGAR